MKYKKKPVIIDAVQWTGAVTPNLIALIKDYQNCGKIDFNNKTIAIKTLEGVMTANVGDYIIKGVKGELYPCKPDIFEATYELVNENFYNG